MQLEDYIFLVQLGLYPTHPTHPTLYIKVRRKKDNNGVINPIIVSFLSVFYIFVSSVSVGSSVGSKPPYTHPTLVPLFI